jgi:hypothetical protein
MENDFSLPVYNKAIFSTSNTYKKQKDNFISFSEQVYVMAQQPGQQYQPGGQQYPPAYSQQHIYDQPQQQHHHQQHLYDQVPAQTSYNAGGFTNSGMTKE